MAKRIEKNVGDLTVLIFPCSHINIKIIEKEVWRKIKEKNYKDRRYCFRRKELVKYRNFKKAMVC